MSRRNRSRALELAAAGAVAYLGWEMLQTRRELDLTGKSVLIAGGSRGLGLLMAKEFVRQGCRRIGICARDERELALAREELQGMGAEVLARRCDVSVQAEVEAWVSEAETAFGAIDVLVNNAAVIQVGPVEAMTLDDFEKAMSIIFWGALYATFAALPGMRRRGSGRIVNITSIGGKVAIPHLLPYDCAKFAMVGLSEGLRSELAKDGITVTTIVPGLMRTGGPVNALFKGNKEAEFTWLSLGAATPLTAMDAERAARRIVQATRRGEAEVTLSWQAKLLRLGHDLFPGAAADLFGVANRVLPEHDGSSGTARGMELASPVAPSPITAMMNRAARNNNEYAGENQQPSVEHAERAGLI